MNRKRKAYSAKPGTALTARELQVLRLVGSGQTLKQAAYQLGIAHKSVHVYTQRARSRLGARSLVHLGALAFQHGLLESA